MKITLHKKKKTKKISFDIQDKRLKETLENCELGAGTLSNPITADGFVTINDHELDTFYAGETIKLKIKRRKKDPNIRLVCCKLGNIGKQFNEGAMTPLNPWAGIFEVVGKNILQLPDSSICLIPDNTNSCSISIPQERKGTPEQLNYLSYSIIFSYTLQKKGDKELSTYFFVLDPVIKVSSSQD